MRAQRPLFAFAPTAGWEHEAPPRTVPSHASAMSTEWRESMKRYPRASIASMTGLATIRAQKLLDGSVAPTPSEAATMDAALRTDASRLLPPRRPLEQCAFTGLGTDRAPRPKVQAMTASRQARVDAWAPRVRASGLSLAEIAQRAEIGPGRTLRILRQGAIAQGLEHEALVAILGIPDEPPTSKSDAKRLSPAS